MLELGTHVGPVGSVASLPNGGWLTGGLADGTVRQWDAEVRPGPVLRFDAPSGAEEVAGIGGVMSLATSDNGELAVGQGSSEPQTWFRSKEEKLTRHPLPTFGGAYSGAVARFDRAGKFLVQGGPGSVVTLAPVDRSEPIGQLDVLPPDIKADLRLTDGRKVIQSNVTSIAAARGSDEFAFVWFGQTKKNPEGVALVGRFRLSGTTLAMGETLSLSEVPFDIAIAPDGTVALAGSVGEVALWKRGSNKLSVYKPPLVPQERTSAVAFSPDGERLAVGAQLGSVTELSMASGKVVAIRPGSGRVVYGIDYSRDGKQIGFAGGDAILRVWQPSGGKTIVGAGDPWPGIENLSWSKDGDWIRWSRTDSSQPIYFNVKTGHPDDGSKASYATPESPDAITDGKGHVKLSRSGETAFSGNLLAMMPFTGAVRLAEDRAIVAGGKSLLALTYDGRNVRPQAFRCPADVQALIGSPNGKQFAAACADGFVRIFSVDPTKNNGRALAAIFAGAAGEWLCWNEVTGVYSSSTGGDRLFGFQVSAGETANATFRPAAQFEETYRKPDWLPKALVNEAPPVIDAPALPTVAATAPELRVVAVQGATREGDRWVSEAKFVQIVVETVNAEGAKLERYVNKPVPDDPRTKGIEDLPASKPNQRIVSVPLDVDDTTVTLLTRKRDGTRSEPVYVRIVRRNAAPGKLHIVSVGVAKYGAAANDLERLTFPAKDAKDLADVFADSKYRSAVISDVDCVLLQDEQATGAAIVKALEELAKRSSWNDRVVVFLSTHGFRNLEDTLITPFDFDSNKPTEKGLSYAKITDLLLKVPCKSMTFFSDTCHAGAATNAAYEASVRQQRTLRDAQVNVFASCEPDQLSVESTANGAFTEALIKALTGGIDQAIDPDTALVTTERIVVPLKDEVREILRRINAKTNQSPTAYAPFSVPLTHVSKL